MTLLTLIPPARRTQLRRGLAAAILGVAIAGIVAQERADTGDEGTRTGVVSGAANPSVGQPAPDFALEEHGTGRLVRLSDYRGKVVVLNFWATWCPPCVAEMPELQRLHSDHAAAGDLVVLAVDVEEPAAAIEEFKQERLLTMPVLSDRTGEVRRHYGLPGLPGTFFIDRDGVVRAKMLGPIIGQPLQDGLAVVGGR